MKVFYLLAAAFLVITAFAYFAYPLGSRTLLFENRVFGWKIYYVKDSKIFVGTHYYYEVFHNGTKIILPKELTGGAREVSEFKAAGGYEIQETNNDGVLILFEGFFEKGKGFLERKIITIMLRPVPGKKNELEVHNLMNGQMAVMSIE